MQKYSSLILFSLFHLKSAFFQEYPSLFSPQLLVQRQESEQELNQVVQKLQSEKQAMVERVSSLSRTLAAMEAEKREIERSSVRLEKDRSALIKTLDKVGGAYMRIGILKNSGVTSDVMVMF